MLLRRVSGLALLFGATFGLTLQFTVPLSVALRAVVITAFACMAILGGALTSVRREQEMPAPPVLAHVAFAAPPPRRFDPREHNEVVPAARKSTASHHPLDGEIRSLRSEVSRAGVMLAMGRLSSAGYAAYTDDIKARLADLEARRAREEAHRLA